MKTSRLLTISALAAMPFAASAASVSLGGCNVAIGTFASIASVSGFDQAVCTVAATSADTLTLSSFTGLMIDPPAHGPYDVVIDIHTASGWQTIFDSPDYVANTLVNTIVPSTISFAATLVDGVRLRSTIDRGWSFHSGNGSETFTLTSTGGSVPEPTSLMLIGLALAAMPAVRRAAKKKV